MNEIVNTLLLAGDKFIPEMHLRQPGFTYSPCGPFTKTKERIQTFIKANYIKLVLNMTWLIEILQVELEEQLLIKYCNNIAKNPKNDGYQRGLGSMVYKVFDKKSTSLADKSASSSGIKNENISN